MLWKFGKLYYEWNADRGRIFYGFFGIRNNEMDIQYYREMEFNLDRWMDVNVIEGKIIYLFGHCNATEELADLLLQRGISVRAILDNSVAKYGNTYRSIPIVSPRTVMDEIPEQTIVYIVARAYAAMKEQLNRFGFKGEVIQLVNYNSYAEYSLTKDTINRKKQRVESGLLIRLKLERKYPGFFKILCPFSALGDVFLAMSYLPYFLEARMIKECVICVIGKACAEVVSLFGDYRTEMYSQKDMDELVQAYLYMQEENFFIAHQDRPYVVKLHRALYVKCIPLEQIYCCGIFGLPVSCKPIRPVRLKKYQGMEQIARGRSVVFSPYAKSITALPKRIWIDVVHDYKGRGYQCFTNVAEGEQPLEGTEAISPEIPELQSIVEYAGTFVGIRSGLCDVIKYAECEKIALYPNYNYCDTKWKAIDMYMLNGWKNIVVEEDFVWKKG